MPKRTGMRKCGTWWQQGGRRAVRGDGEAGPQPCDGWASSHLSLTVS